jgi:hypothetical protein
MPFPGQGHDAAHQARVAGAQQSPGRNMAMMKNTIRISASVETWFMTLACVWLCHS